MPCGISTSASVQPGWRSSSVVSSSSGAPAAHACGREAVGKATGTDVSATREAGEHLGQAVLEVRCRGEDRGGDRARRLVVSVAREAGGDQRVVVRPDRPGVVAERVVAGLARAEGADAPAGVELLVEQPLGGGGCLARRRAGRTRAGGRCWRSGCRPAACRRRARARDSRARASRSRAGSARGGRRRAARGARRAPRRPTPRGRGGPRGAARRRRSPGSRRSRSGPARACRRRTGSSSSCPSSTG